MFLKKIEIKNYKVLNNIDVTLNKSNFPNVFSIASVNGGGKSTLLQFVFTTLHCFNDENRHKYIKNLLEDIQVESDEKLVNFIIEKDNKIYTLDFILASIKTNKRDFDFDEINNLIDEARIQNPELVTKIESQYIEKTENEVIEEVNSDEKKTNEIEEKDIKDIDLEYLEENKNIFKQQQLEKQYDSLDEKKNDLKKNDLLKKAFTSSNNINIFVSESLMVNLLKSNRRLPDPLANISSLDIKKRLENNLKEKEKEIDKLNDKRELYIIQLFEYKKEQEKNLKNYLQENNYKIITKLNEKTIFLLKTDMPKDLQKELSESIYLSAPNSQIFLFLSKDARTEIFNHSSENNYTKHIEGAKKDLPNFYTYDFSSTQFILKSLQKAINKDIEIRRTTNEYGKNYTLLKKQLKDFLGKDVSEDKAGKRVVFKLEDNSQELLPENLSHGELKKLGIYIWLNYLIKKESIVLFDEIDIALHPKWQYEIVKELSGWSENSQFLLATHSAQILSSTYYKNIIKLQKRESVQYNRPPIDRDINSIIIEYMDSIKFPEDLKDLHKDYRQLIIDGKLNSDEAIKLKEIILEYESENSSFFQDINFDLELI